jgi:hypothetical protein
MAVFSIQKWEYFMKTNRCISFCLMAALFIAGCADKNAALPDSPKMRSLPASGGDKKQAELVTKKTTSAEKSIEHDVLSYRMYLNAIAEQRALMKSALKSTAASAVTVPLAAAPAAPEGTVPPFGNLKTIVVKTTMNETFVPVNQEDDEDKSDADGE